MSGNSSLALAVEAVKPYNVSGYTFAHREYVASVVLFSLLFFLVISVNGIVLITFLLKPQLRTPFSIYLISLLFCNLMYALLRNPVEVINKAYFTWWTGNYSCSLRLYAFYVLEPVAFYTHASITLNRLWAIRFPLCYRTFHTTKSAVTLSLTVWLFVHLLTLPGFVLDAVYYRVPAESGSCWFNDAAQKGWIISVEVVFCLFGEMIILSAYPFLWWKKKQSRKIFNKPYGNESHENEMRPTPVASEKHGSGKSSPPSPGNKSRSFSVLTVMTISVFFTWTPRAVIFAIDPFGDTIPNALVIAASVLYELQSALDPILFVAVLKDVRQEVFNVMKLKHHDRAVGPCR